MTPREQEILLLTCHLGDPDRKPLSPAQMRKLLQRAGERIPRSETEWMHLGYSARDAAYICMLLGQTEQLDWYVRRGKKRGCVPITRDDPAYPQRLLRRLGLECPGSLWTKGDISILDRPCVALVGSRELDSRNANFAIEAGKQAACQGYVLVSGNARGADQAAQESCLFHGGKVISVVADQLEDCPKHKNILYIAENGFDLPFAAYRALSRNRIIHCLPSVTLVAQCAKGKGGTWDGTVKNLKYGWSPVFCLDDGSDGMQALCDLGADAIALGQLADISALRPAVAGMFSD